MLGLDPDGLEELGVQVEQTFAFMHPDEFQFVLGFLHRLDSTADRVFFDSLAASPDLVAEALTGSSGPLQLEDVQPLEFPELGEASGAMTGKLRTAGIRFQSELVVFREGSVGAVLIVACLDGDQPMLKLTDLAGLLLVRIRNA